jgi:uncharacterized damage-inducible protein DinB
MNEINLAVEYIKELESEATSTRKCLEKMREDLFDWKPHPKSMAMGYLALLVAEIPLWIAVMIEKSEIDFATFEHKQFKSGPDLVTFFNENHQAAKHALHRIPSEQLSEPFHLKNQGQVLFSSPKKDNITSSINHMVHHRGQLTVYMRLNDIPVPSIYGPSADEKIF